MTDASDEKLTEIVELKPAEDLASRASCLHVLFMDIDDLIDFDFEEFFRKEKRKPKTIEMSPISKKIQKKIDKIGLDI